MILKENPQELFLPIDPDHIPYNDNGFLELRGWGWDLLEQQLRQIKGCALMLSHPVWHPEVDSVTEQQEIIQKLIDEKYKENLEQYVDRFETYAYNMVRSVMGALEQELPVIMFLEAKDDERYWLSVRLRLDKV